MKPSLDRHSLLHSAQHHLVYCLDWFLVSGFCCYGVETYLLEYPSSMSLLYMTWVRYANEMK